MVVVRMRLQPRSALGQLQSRHYSAECRASWPSLLCATKNAYRRNRTGIVVLLKNLKNYLRNRRGVASIEAALGTVAILTASAACPGPVPAGQHPDDHPARRRYPGGHREPGRSTRSGLCADAGQISAPGAVPHLECRFCGLRGVQETPPAPHTPAA